MPFLAAGPQVNATLGGGELNVSLELLAVLRETRALLARPDNDFAWSSWRDGRAALSEMDGHIAKLEQEQMPSLSEIAILFAPTGPIQEVSLSSGWGREFLAVSAKFDSVTEAAYP